MKKKNEMVCQTFEASEASETKNYKTGKSCCQMTSEICVTFIKIDPNK